jgi:hypothetical protein
MKTTPHKLAPGQTWEGALLNGLPRTQRRIIAVDDTGVLWEKMTKKPLRRMYFSSHETFTLWAERLLP